MNKVVDCPMIPDVKVLAKVIRASHSASRPATCRGSALSTLKRAIIVTSAPYPAARRPTVGHGRLGDRPLGTDQPLVAAGQALAAGGPAPRQRRPTAVNGRMLRPVALSTSLTRMPMTATAGPPPQPEDPPGDRPIRTPLSWLSFCADTAPLLH